MLSSKLCFYYIFNTSLPINSIIIININNNLLHYNNNNLLLNNNINNNIINNNNNNNSMINNNNNNNSYNFIENLNFVPSLVYGFTCGSSLLSTYDPLLIYAYIIICFIKPLLLYIYSTKYIQKYIIFIKYKLFYKYNIFSIIINYINKLFKYKKHTNNIIKINNENNNETNIEINNETNNEINNETNNETNIEVKTVTEIEVEVEVIPEIDGMSVIVMSLQHLTVLMTFGLTYPVLAIIITITILFDYIYWRLQIGKYIDINKQKNNIIINDLSNNNSNNFSNNNNINESFKQSIIVINQSMIRNSTINIMNYNNQSTKNQLINNQIIKDTNILLNNNNSIENNIENSNENQSNNNNNTNNFNEINDTKDEIIIISNELENMFIDSWKVLYYCSNWMILVISLFWSFLFFDMIADKYGSFNGGMVSLIYFIFINIIYYYFDKLLYIINKYTNNNNYINKLIIWYFQYLHIFDNKEDNNEILLFNETIQTQSNHRTISRNIGLELEETIQS